MPLRLLSRTKHSSQDHQLLLIISGGINNSIIISWSMFIAAKWQTPYGRGEERCWRPPLFLPTSWGLKRTHDNVREGRPSACGGDDKRGGGLKGTVGLLPEHRENVGCSDRTTTTVGCRWRWHQRRWRFWVGGRQAGWGGCGCDDVDGNSRRLGVVWESCRWWKWTYVAAMRFLALIELSGPSMDGDALVVLNWCHKYCHILL
jgi:hypothetical protein